jgi:hypothetical protein
METSSYSSEDVDSFGGSTDEDEEDKGPSIDEILATVTKTIHTMLEQNTRNRKIYDNYLENTKKNGGVYRKHLLKHLEDIHRESDLLKKYLSIKCMIGGVLSIGIDWYILHDVKNTMKRMKEAELLYEVFKQMEDMHKIMKGVERVKKEELLEEVSKQMEDMNTMMKGEYFHDPTD